MSLNLRIMDSQFSYKDIQTDLTVGQALSKLGGVWITENEQGQWFLTPLENLLTRIEQVLEKYKDDAQDEEPDFEFEFFALTISQIASEFIRRNIKLSDMILIVSNKVFYDRSWGANPNSAFIEVSRPEAADPEFNAMHYLDVQKYIPDWNITLNNLKRLGQDQLYTEEMMKTCLLRLINRFIPDQSQLIKDKTSNQIAEMLLKLDSRVDKMTHYRQQLFAAHRLPGEILQGAMTRFQNLLDIVYPSSEVGHASTRAEMLKTAIISFLPDCVASPLTAEMKRRSYKGKALTFQEICSRAYKPSNELMTEVAIPLQFGRNIGQDSAAKLIQFNSIQTVNRQILKPKQTVVNDYNRMYHTGFPLYTSPSPSGGQRSDGTGAWPKPSIIQNSDAYWQTANLC
jgi:hypothetical protein